MQMLSSVWLLYFYPRPPRGGRLPLLIFPATPPRFLSTPSARRATGTECIFAVCVGISIHALREEGDGIHGTGHGHPCNFYPRPPRGGRPHDPRIP